MKPIHWVGIGCGGCLLLVLAVAFLAVGGIFYVRTVVHDSEQITHDIEILEKEYQFSPPEDQAIDQKRFPVFLDARSALYNQSSPILQPIIEFAHADLETSETSRFHIFSDIAKIMFKVPTFKQSQLEIFKKTQMSSPEYEYWTWIMAREISTWIDLDADKEKREMAQQYFAPLKQFESNAKEYEKKTPGTNIHGGPFDYSMFLQKLRSKEYTNESNSEIVFAQKDRILSSSDSVFLDSWILEFN